MVELYRFGLLPTGLTRLGFTLFNWGVDFLVKLAQVGPAPVCGCRPLCYVPLPLPPAPSPQEHLTNHVVAQTRSASLEIGLARGVHREYRETVEEMVEAGEELARALERMGDNLVKGAEVAFLKVVQKKREVEDREGLDQAGESEIESEIEKFALVFNFEDEGFGEGDGCYY